MSCDNSYDMFVYCSIRILCLFQASVSPGAPTSTPSMLELQAWVTACRSYLNTDMGSYLLRSGRDESLLLGDLHLNIGEIMRPMDAAAGENNDNSFLHRTILKQTNIVFL